MELLPVDTDDDNDVDAKGLTAGKDRKERPETAVSSILSHGGSDDASLCCDKASVSAAISSWSSSVDEGAGEVFNEVKERDNDNSFDDDADDSIDEKCSDQFE